MRRAAGAILLAVVVAALPATARAAPVPSQPPLIHDGPTGRVLLSAGWRRRMDPRDAGLAAHWERRPPRTGWTPVRIPDAWNATDFTQQGFIGEPVWYRTDFRLPSSSPSLGWRLRFEAVNYHATVWLNGKRIGEHAGGYLPFEVDLAHAARRIRANRLVVRVDNRRLPTDFPPSSYSNADEPGGGWWNWGGIVREVELRRVNGLYFDEVQVTPRLGCGGCPATVRFHAVVRNAGADAARAKVTATIGGRSVRLGAARIRRGAIHAFSGTARIPRPHVWWPSDPYLYPTGLTASAGGSARATYRLHTGLRTVGRAGDGHLLVNGVPVQLRGVAVHEDAPGKGAALDDADRAQLAAEVKQVGATLVRAHYPLHPAFEELADREGLLLWSEVPVYRLVTGFMEVPGVVGAAVDEVRQNVLANRNHASVIVWSLGNELDETFPGAINRYVTAATRVAHALDGSRPVGMAIEAHRQTACSPRLNALDVIGANEYFGWYGGSSGDLSPYLDELHACHPGKAIIVTEFGAEANRDGPVEQKGTYQFQQAFIATHLAVMAGKPWLSGVDYWTLREFVCAPGWTGGNPLPQPPMHQKGVLSYQGQPKPAYATLQAAYRSVVQIPGPAPGT
ncbi:glycoside hydrolase family 2 protein [Candidatus Solirubrobacter pratensis]|uniref:glycoside hydrolase family 2 protein n=1 Tax=Candidatus Solirubrobacter pratensis TaxID=1298857 RepID=UPI000416E3B0|nr:glycoside hydrolase family 2 [Candidatus Solirubrobacter pratensis]